MLAGQRRSAGAAEHQGQHHRGGAGGIYEQGGGSSCCSKTAATAAAAAASKRVSQISFRCKAWCYHCTFIAVSMSNAHHCVIRQRTDRACDGGTQIYLNGRRHPCYHSGIRTKSARTCGRRQRRSDMHPTSEAVCPHSQYTRRVFGQPPAQFEFKYYLRVSLHRSYILHEERFLLFAC